MIEETIDKNNEFRQGRYLQLMGIDRWRLRVTDSLLLCYRYDLYDLEHRWVGTLLADVVLQDKAEHQLVEKIALATQKQVKGGLSKQLCNQPDLEKNVLILLGPEVARHFSSLDISKKVISHSPCELLRNPSLKTKTWQDLKKAMQWMEV